MNKFVMGIFIVAAKKKEQYWVCGGYCSSGAISASCGISYKRKMNNVICPDKKQMCILQCL